MSFFHSRSTTSSITPHCIVTCASAMALSLVTSFIKLPSLPFGGSATMFSMFFLCLVGYMFGLKTGLITGISYGILQFMINPRVFAPFQVLLDYPLAFGALGLSGLFYQKKHGLMIGYITGVIGRYLFHLISGQMFFASYAPKGMNSLVYNIMYNCSYLLPELILTVIILSLPPVARAIAFVKKQAIGK